MDKPQSLSMRDYLVRKLAVKLMVSEKVIDAVVVHQFSEANRALQTNDSIEISGFGKFLFNKKKAIKKLEKMYMKKAYFENALKEEGITEQRRNSLQTKLDNTDAGIVVLKPKIYGTVEDLRGMEEPSDSLLQYEGDNKED